MKQLHTRDCFALLHIKQLTENEKKKIVDAIILFQEKHDKTIKGRCVYNGKPTKYIRIQVVQQHHLRV